MQLELKQMKDYTHSLRSLYQKGGKFAKASEKARVIESLLQDNSTTPEQLNTTNHGENRIQCCVKYQLPGACRLITIQDNGIILFCFAGTHDEVDRWLNKNKGLTLATNNKQLTTTNISQNIKDSELRTSGESALTEGMLYSKISEKYFNILMDGVAPIAVAKLIQIESVNSEEDIYKVVATLDDVKKQSVIYDTFCFLRQNKIQEAIERIKIFTGENKEINKLSKEEIIELANSDKIKTIPIDGPNYERVFSYYIQNTEYMDWMLFLHPDQEKLVYDDYYGSAKLVGVSGSGKTCIIVKRALNLAESYPDETQIQELFDEFSEILSLDKTAEDGKNNSSLGLLTV